MTDPRIGVVGATGAVGQVTLALLAERGFGQVRAFASSRSAGSTVTYGDGEVGVEEATVEALGAVSQASGSSLKQVMLALVKHDAFRTRAGGAQ